MMSQKRDPKNKMRGICIMVLDIEHRIYYSDIYSDTHVERRYNNVTINGGNRHESRH